MYKCIQVPAHHNNADMSFWPKKWLLTMHIYSYHISNLKKILIEIPQNICHLNEFNYLPMKHYKQKK